MSDKKRLVNDNSGGYMSVDRTEAIKANWERIQKLTLPGSNKETEEKPVAPKAKAVVKKPSRTK